jgi:signal transduction histidine kinase
VIAKTRLAWHAPDGVSGMPLVDPLHDPAARQVLDNLLAIQMQLELATGIPVSVYGPTGQTLPGISPVRSRPGEQGTPLAKDLLTPRSWPQHSGQMLEVIYGSNLHFFITPFILGSVPLAQIILGPLQIFEPGAQESRADSSESPAAITAMIGAPVLASWKAQAAAEIARTLVSRLSMPNAEATPRLSPPEQPLRLRDGESTALPLRGNTVHSRPESAIRLGALAQDALLPDRSATEQVQTVIESTPMIQTPPGNPDSTPAWPAPPRALSAGGHQTENQNSAASLFHALVETMPQAVIISGAPDGHIVLANRSARMLWPRLLGRQAPGVETSAPLRSWVSADQYPPEWLGLSVALHQAESFRAEISVEIEADPLSQGQPAEQAKQPPTSPTDTLVRGPRQYPMLVSAFPLRTAQGIASHAVAIFEDLSGLLERELFKDELLLVAAHDARNPLTLISSYAQLLERNLAMEIPPGQVLERARGRLADIQEQVEHLSELTDQLYTVTRLESARQRPYSETVNLARLIQRSAIDQQMLTPGRTIETVVEHDPCQVQGDQTQLQQIIMRLLKNAVRYSHPDKPISVSLRCTPENNPLWAEVSVRDQGVGIPRADLPHIFERFYRVIGNEQRARVAGIRPPGNEPTNLGLGLYLCKQLIERMGGHIWAESVEGKGTIVSFTAPLKQ